MTLNRYLNKRKIKLTQRQKMVLGKRLARSYRDRNPESEVRTIKITEEGQEMRVVNYPRSFMDTHGTRIVDKYLKQRKQFQKKRSIPVNGLGYGAVSLRN